MAAVKIRLEVLEDMLNVLLHVLDENGKVIYRTVITKDSPAATGMTIMHTLGHYGK